MSKKKLLILSIIFLLFSTFAFFNAFNSSEIVIDLNDSAYSYLPESAKKFIESEAKKGNKVLTEKNKEPKKIYLNPKYVQYLAMSEEEKKDLEVIPQVYTYDFISAKIAQSNLPSYYKLDNLVIKDQSTLGICWAFAVVSSIETNMLTTGLTNKTINFSERQLDYAMANELKEVDNPYSVAEINNHLSSYYEIDYHELGSGSNFIEAYKYLNMGISPVEEAVWGKYDTSYSKRTISEVLNYDNVDYSTSEYVIYGDNIYNNPIYTYDARQEFVEQLKSHIVNYGSLYVVTASPDSSAGSCFNSRKMLINYDETKSDCKNAQYHAMSLVGWDDEYNGGAWILKNSWGNSLPYVYMAYESDFFDVSGIVKMDAKNWDNGYNFTKKNKSSYTINDYEVTYYKSVDFNENLERINFVSWGIEATYKVYYKNGNGSYKLLKTVSKDLPGLITIDVENVILDKSSFTIRVTTDNGFIDDGLNVFTSNSSNEEYKETYKFDNTIRNLKEQLIVRNIESGTRLNYYIFDEYGTKYNDDSTAYVINGTVDIDYTLPVLPSGTYFLTLDENYFKVQLEKEIELRVDDKYQIIYELDDDLKIREISYSVSDSQVASVDDAGLITGLKPGKTTIVVNINGNIEIPIIVNVYKESNVEALSILESDQTIYLSLLDQIDLHLNVVPAIYDKSDFTWTTSDDTIALVEAGLVKFLKEGTVKIEVSAGDLSDEIVFDVIDSTSNVTLYAPKTTINVGETMTLTHSSVNSRYRYSTSNAEVLSVRNGIVTGLKNGYAWVYYKYGNDIAGVLINVIDPNQNVNLTIDPNGGKYNNSSDILTIQENSLTLIDLQEPVYDVTITLVADETETVNITHKFAKFNLTGDGLINNQRYTFGFNDGTLTALWNYTSYLLPNKTKEGMTFVGWYKDSNFTEFFGKDISFVPKSDITLYAKFVDVRVGDINDDEEIDITDLVILRKYLALLVELNSKENMAADINKDGNVDITDLVILRKYLAGLEEIQ